LADFPIASRDREIEFRIRRQDIDRQRSGVNPEIGSSQEQSDQQTDDPDGYLLDYVLQNWKRESSPTPL
jgi:hypothetical protein